MRPEATTNDLGNDSREQPLRRSDWSELATNKIYTIARNAMEY